MLKTYRSHKTVKAAKIMDIHTERHPNGKCFLVFSDGRKEVSPEYRMKHKPEVGGYYVQYADDYESFSPAEPFEEGYTEC